MVVAGLLFVSSCKSTRVLSPVAPDRAVEQVLTSMQAAQVSFDFFSARFAGSVNYGGTQTDIGGTIRIRKDSAIFVSVAPFFGIEVARILITPDHVKILNRLEGTYFEGDMEKINGMLNADLDFYMLQSMLLGNDLVHFSTRNFRLSDDKEMLLLHNPERTRIDSRLPNTERFEQNLWLDKQSFRITQTTLFEKDSNRNIQASYPGFTTVQGQSFPSEILLLFSDLSATAQLTAKYSRITIDQPQQITFSIPSRYTPMDF
jgi:outer membrane lipoprotein-sorting protein